MANMIREPLSDSEWERRLSDMEKLADHAQNMVDKSSSSVLVRLRGTIKQATSDTVDALKFLTEHTERTTEKVEKASSKMHEAVEKHHTEAYERTRDHIKKYHPQELLKQSIGFVGENLPEIAGWALVIKTMEELSKNTQDLLVSFGGSQGRVEQFTDSLLSVQMHSQMTTEQMLELAKAFRTVGFDLTSDEIPDLKEYVDMSGEAMQMFGLSAETAALYGKNMIDSGASTAAMSNSLQDLYSVMQKQNLSVEDMNTSITTAVSLVENFGAVSQSSVGQLAQQVTEATGSFRALGLESSKVGALIQSNMADPNKRMGIAAMIAGQTGGDLFALDYKLSQGGGTQEQLVAALKYLNSFNKIRDTTGWSEADKGKYGTILQSNMTGAAQAFGISPDMLNVLVKDYESSKHSHPGIGIDQWSATKLEEAQRKDNDMASWNQGLAALKSDFSKLGPALEVTLGSLAQIVGGPLLDTINLILPPLNAFLKTLVAIVNNPVGKKLVELAVGASLVVAGFAAWAPIMAAFSGIVTSISTVIMGATSQMLLFGTAISSAIAYVGGLSGLLSFMGSAVTWLIGLIEPVALLSGAITLLLNPITWVVAGVVALGAALWTFRKEIGNVFKGVGLLSSGNPTDMAKGFNMFLDMFFFRLRDWLSNLLKGVFEIFNHIGDWSKNLGSAVAVGVKAVGKGIADTMQLPQLNKIPNKADGSGIWSDPSIGAISKHFEGNGRAGQVNMDPNSKAGWDYGAWQFNATNGIPQAYVAWAKGHDTKRYQALAPALGSVNQGSSGAFGKTWAALGAADNKGFLESQHQFALAHYLQPLMEHFPRLSHSKVLQEQAFAGSIQKGVGSEHNFKSGIMGQMVLAGVNDKNVDDFEFVKRLTDREIATYGENAGRYKKEGEMELTLLMAEHMKQVAENTKNIHDTQQKQAVETNKNAKVAKQAMQMATNPNVATAQAVANKVGANGI